MILDESGWFLFLPLTAMAVLAVAIVAFAGTVGNEAGFEDDDGNLVDNTGNTLIDWNTLRTGDLVAISDDDAHARGRQGVQRLHVQGHRGLASHNLRLGLQRRHEAGRSICPDVITAKAPNKDDLKRIYLASTTKPVTS